MLKYLLHFLLLFLLSFNICKAQEVTPDSTSSTSIEKIKPPHSPKKAAIYAAALPGLGQIYNKKYWKLPLVYGGIGTSVYFIIRNNRFYNDFFQAYKARVDDDVNTVDIWYPGLPDGVVLQNLETTRNWLEISYIATLGVYLLQIVDATVDAHFFNFDVSDDLSLNVKPYFQPLPNQTAGLTLTLNLKK